MLLVVVAIFIATLVKQLLIGRSADPRGVEVLESEIGSQIMLAAKVRMRD